MQQKMKKNLFPCVIFSDSRDPIFNARDPNRVPETPLKSLYTPTVEESARKFRNLPLPTNERPASSPLHDTRTVNLDLVQCECHTGK